jgi:hypothetical protein
MSIKYTVMSTVEAFLSDAAQEAQQENQLIGLYLTRDKEFNQVVVGIHSSGSAWPLFTMKKSSFSRHGDLPPMAFATTGNNNLLVIIYPEAFDTYNDPVPDYHYGLLGLRKSGDSEVVITSQNPDGEVHVVATLTADGLRAEAYVSPTAGIPLTSKRQIKFA